jgi:hypothetical protein
MKKLSIPIIWLLILAVPGQAQHILSLDLGTIRNTQKPINGLNVSGFYYFNPHLTAGMEVNRFFPVNRQSAEEGLQISAWDIELNVHYLFSVYKKMNLYPITGISHTVDRELISAKGLSHYESFWSLNTGAGILWEFGNWSPHIEYSFAWGQQNQQFLLAGISYEIELGPEHKAR